MADQAEEKSGKEEKMGFHFLPSLPGWCSWELCVYVYVDTSPIKKVQLRRLRRFSDILPSNSSNGGESAPAAVVATSPEKSPARPLKPGWKAFEQSGILVQFPPANPVS